MATTRKSNYRLYEACKNCSEITKEEKCRQGFDVGYRRRGKDNHCQKCSGQVKHWKSVFGRETYTYEEDMDVNKVSTKHDIVLLTALLEKMMKEL